MKLEISRQIFGKYSNTKFHPVRAEISARTDMTKLIFTFRNFANEFIGDRRWHSSTIDVRSFRVADCDTDHYLVVAKFRERLVVRKKAAQNSEGGRFNLRKINDLEVRKQFQMEITNRFAALVNLREDEHINRGLGVH